MFLELDRFPESRVAAVDDAGGSIVYGRLNAYHKPLIGRVGARSVAFILCRNRVGALAAYVACMNLRVVPLLLGAGIDEELLRHLMTLYTPAYLWLPLELRGSYRTWPALFTADGYTLLKTDWEPYPVYGGLSMLLATSGSTGSPKLVRHSEANPAVNAQNVSRVFGFTEEDRGMCDLPMQYTMGLNVILSHLAAGARVLLAENNLMSPAFWEFFLRERATDFTGVPFSYAVLMKLGFTRMSLPHLRILAEGGGKLRNERFAELARYANITGRKFFATFGTTETTARLAFLPPALAAEKTGSIGNAIPGGELFLLDAEGREIGGAEAEGELGYRGPNVTLGYALCKDDLLKGDEWRGRYVTGDLARRDADGCYYILGRKTRFLKLYGLRISLDQCERLVSGEFAVDAACVGDDTQLRAYVAGDVNPDDVRRYLLAKTGLFGAAVQVFAVGAIPRQESGKTAYQALQQQPIGKDAI